MSITLTERAATHIKRFLEKTGGERLRVGVKTTGCSGYMYTVAPTAEITTADQVFESRGVKVVIDEQSLRILNGTEVDYTREGINEGFKFHNPNAKATCGCGESFSVD